MTISNKSRKLLCFTKWPILTGKIGKNIPFYGEKSFVGLTSESGKNYNKK
jgi:hypothetical protein